MEPLEIAEQRDEGDEQTALTADELRAAISSYQSEIERFDYGPTKDQLLGPFTVFCLIMNRTIASGIFKLPPSILKRCGSSGLALVLWFAGGIIATCAVIVWIEMALSIPIYNIADGTGQIRKVSTPRSGGDKNYLEYVYNRPRLLMTCVFGITFIIYGNLAGNAIQFAIYMTQATNPQCTSGCIDSLKGQVIGWAVGVLTFCALLNISTRRSAIVLNNILAVIKVLFLVVVSFVGIIWGTTHGDGCRQISFTQYDDTGTFGDIVQAILFAVFPYTGYEQPFYVLAEVRKPKRSFARAVSLTMATALVFYPLINVGYLCVSPYRGKDTVPDNMALALFEKMANPSGDPGEKQDDALVTAMNLILALFIFGNLMAQTYTASRVKQEIAKEGILPWSLVFADSSDTLISRLRGSRPSGREPTYQMVHNHAGQTPIAATVLHWAFEVILVLAVGIPLESVDTSYTILTYIYTYVIIVLLGFLTSVGLLYLKVDSFILGQSGRRWSSKTAWTPWLDPLPVVLATLSLGFILFSSFASPSSVFVPPSEPPHWVPPFVGLSSVVFGVLWWMGIRFREWRKRQRLQTTRYPYVDVDPEDGEGIMRVEVVRPEWVGKQEARLNRRRVNRD